MKTHINLTFVPQVTGAYELTDEPSYQWKLNFEHAEGILLEGTEQFVLKYQYFKGPQRIRLGPTSQYWSVYISRERTLTWIKCLENPLQNEKVTSRVLSETYLKAMTETGYLKPGHPLNPTKNTDSFIETLDKGSVIIYEDAPAFKKFEFKGTQLKGTWVMTREPDTNLWILAKSSSPKE